MTRLMRISLASLLGFAFVTSSLPANAFSFPSRVGTRTPAEEIFSTQGLSARSGYARPVGPFRLATITAATLIVTFGLAAVHAQTSLSPLQSEFLIAPVSRITWSLQFEALRSSVSPGYWGPLLAIPVVRAVWKALLFAMKRTVSEFDRYRISSLPLWKRALVAASIAAKVAHELLLAYALLAVLYLIPRQLYGFWMDPQISAPLYIGIRNVALAVAAVTILSVAAAAASLCMDAVRERVIRYETISYETIRRGADIALGKSSETKRPARWRPIAGLVLSAAACIAVNRIFDVPIDQAIVIGATYLLLALFLMVSLQGISSLVRRSVYAILLATLAFLWFVILSAWTPEPQTVFPLAMKEANNGASLAMGFVGAGFSLMSSVPARAAARIRIAVLTVLLSLAPGLFAQTPNVHDPAPVKPAVTAEQVENEISDVEAVKIALEEGRQKIEADLDALVRRYDRNNGRQKSADSGLSANAPDVLKRRLFLLRAVTSGYLYDPNIAREIGELRRSTAPLADKKKAIEDRIARAWYDFAIGRTAEYRNGKILVGIPDPQAGPLQKRLRQLAFITDIMERFENQYGPLFIPQGQATLIAPESEKDGMDFTIRLFSATIEQKAALSSAVTLRNYGPRRRADGSVVHVFFQREYRMGLAAKNVSQVTAEEKWIIVDMTTGQQLLVSQAYRRSLSSRIENEISKDESGEHGHVRVPPFEPLDAVAAPVASMARRSSTPAQTSSSTDSFWRMSPLFLLLATFKRSIKRGPHRPRIAWFSNEAGGEWTPHMLHILNSMDKSMLLRISRETSFWPSAVEIIVAVRPINDLRDFLGKAKAHMERKSLPHAEHKASALVWAINKVLASAATSTRVPDGMTLPLSELMRRAS